MYRLARIARTKHARELTAYPANHLCSRGLAGLPALISKYQTVFCRWGHRPTICAAFVAPKNLVSTSLGWLGSRPGLWHCVSLDLANGNGHLPAGFALCFAHDRPLLSPGTHLCGRDSSGCSWRFLRLYDNLCRWHGNRCGRLACAQTGSVALAVCIFCKFSHSTLSDSLPK